MAIFVQPRRDFASPLVDQSLKRGTDGLQFLPQFDKFWVPEIAEARARMESVTELAQRATRDL